MIPDSIDRFASRRSTVRADRGLVATSQPLAAEAGIEILRSGGNAFDAAVGTAAALNVVEPTSTGLGGDVFALYRTADDSVGAMRSCGGAPSGATIERVQTAVDEADTETLSRWYPDSHEYMTDSAAEIEMPFRGPHAVTVPGTARGWEATVREHGRLSLDDALEPAIHYATEGFPVSEVIADDWAQAEQLFEDSHARSAYLTDGKAPKAGDRIRLPELGSSLRKIADHGADIVYEGEIAEQIAAEVQSNGGWLTVEDLAEFEPEFLEPVSATYRGTEIYELPPNNQGLIALEALNIAEELGAGEYDYDDPSRTHYFIEAMKRAFHDGHRYITDPEHESTPPLGAVSWAQKRAAKINETAAENVSYGQRDGHDPAEDADTVLLCVADDEGNVVSYINSRFAGFGSGLVAGDTGIALQNRGASFSLDPDHPNSLAPGKRPFHTLIPALAKFGENDWAAFGVMGGYMQPQGHVQVLSNIIDYDMSLQTALDAPRWRYRVDGTVAVEERFGGNLQQTELARKNHDIQILPPTSFGGAQIVRLSEGVLSGATEPRKDGTVVGY